MVAIVLSIFLVAMLWAVVVFLKLHLGIAVVGTLAVALTWAAALGWRRLQARRAAGAIEKALKSQAEAQSHAARPDQQA